MKCPYRKIVETKHQYNSDITTEEFCECYGVKCPFYEKPYGNEECTKAKKDGKMN